ncbi:MAG: hypothetical protein PUE51_11345 [Veillonellaceae bacterium]|nr:hypothetical protein [Veillonellaceae bacterium]
MKKAKKVHAWTFLGFLFSVFYVIFAPCRDFIARQSVFQQESASRTANTYTKNNEREREKGKGGFSS